VGATYRRGAASVDKVPMISVILCVRNVERLKSFYQAFLGLPVAEEISGEWVVLTADAVELGLHLVGV
jgi:catechol-2,3-dioxygenase